MQLPSGSPFSFARPKENGRKEKDAEIERSLKE
jgi:hypothetical protein